MPFVNRAWGLPENQFRMDGLKNGTPPIQRFSDVGDIMARVLASTTAPDKRVGEKSPLHIYHVHSILKTFPDAKILITKRDLRAAFFSQSMRSRRNKFSHRGFKLFNFVASWTIANQLSNQFIQRYGDERIHIVPFEPLVQSPKQTLREVCEFLEIEFEESMLDLQFENSSFEDVPDRAGVNAKSADRWQDKLDSQTKTRLDFLASEDLQDAGYEIGKTAPSWSDRVTKTAIRVANKIALSKPELVCYLGRDPRYSKLQKQFEKGMFAGMFGPRVFILGNHKSGTTAIAKLLARLSGLDATIDFPGNIRKDGYALARGEYSFDDIVNKHPWLFCRPIVKIPALTFVANEIEQRFPDSKIIFVIRDPRDNIRSILNRRKIPGDKTEIPALRRWLMWLQNRPSMDAKVWGESEYGYVGVLAKRWNDAIKNLKNMQESPIVVRYESFNSEKQVTIESLAKQLELEPQGEIKNWLDVQYQPAGNPSVQWRKFFGKKNLAAIETICGETMNSLGYPKSIL